MIGRLLTCLLIIALWSGVSAQNVAPRLQTIQKIGDANATVAVNTTNVWTNAALTATRTWALPAASTIPAGATIVVSDMVGAISTPGQNVIIDGNGTDTINGRNFYTITQSWGSTTFTSNGTNGWAATAQAADIPNVAFTTAINPLGATQGPLTVIKLAPLPPGSPGAGVGWIALTKGTNAGTCKLVALAGLSATPVTIVDNIGGGGLSQGGC